MRLEPEDIEACEFRIRRRGFDPTEVRSFLASVAAQLRSSSTETRHPGDVPHELLDRAKYLAAAVIDEAERRATQTEAEAKARATRMEAEASARAAQIEAEARARAAGIEARADARSSDASGELLPWAELRDQIAAVLATAEQQAASRVLEAEVEAEGVLADAAVHAQRMRLEASTNAARLMDEGRADLAYVRALKEATQREAAETIERAERAALDRWNATDAQIRAFSGMVMGDALARVKALSAELSDAHELLVEIDRVIEEPPRFDPVDPIDLREPHPD